MIRYPISRAELEAKINAIKPGWLGRAQGRTDGLKTAGKFAESSHIWSEIKTAFIDLQFNKCAYCERKIGDAAYDLKDFDIEHYRPKSEVKSWPSANVKKARKLDYDFPLGEATDNGYYLLAYNICNYAIACTGCNSSLKSSYFPVAGTRVLDSDDYALLKNEEPHLLCPVGDTDEDDPEDVITFVGYTPVPKHTTGRRYKRARVTIDFFDLAIRDDLILQRAGVICNIWLAQEVLKNPAMSPEAKAMAQLIIDVAVSRKSAHTNCARAYYRLCRQDPDRARLYMQEAKPLYAKLLEKMKQLSENAPAE